MREFVNRNSILLNGKPYSFTIPIHKASQNKLIKDTKLSFGKADEDKFLKTVSTAYKKAPYFERVLPVIEEIIWKNRING